MVARTPRHLMNMRASFRSTPNQVPAAALPPARTLSSGKLPLVAEIAAAVTVLDHLLRRQCVQVNTLCLTFPSRPMAVLALTDVPMRCGMTVGLGPIASAFSGDGHHGRYRRYSGRDVNAAQARP